MPKIAAYQRSTVQTAAPSVRATSSPGAAIGQAGANLGEALSGLANTIIERKAAQQKEDQYFATQRIGRIATDSATDFEVAFKQKLETDAYNSGDAVDKWTVDTTDKLLDIPDEKVRFQVNDHIQSLASKLKDQLAGHEASQRKVVSVNAREGTFKSTSKAAYQGFGSLDDNLAIVNKAVANDPTMGQIEKENTLIAYQSGVAESYIKGVVSRSPQAAIELIKSGTFSRYLGRKKLESIDDEAKTLIKAQEADNKTAKIEAERLKKEQLEVARQDANKNLTDLEVTGKLTRKKVAGYRSTLNEDEYRQWYDRIEAREEKIKKAAKGDGEFKTDKALDAKFYRRIVSDPESVTDGEILDRIGDGLSHSSAKALIDERAKRIKGEYDPLKKAGQEAVIANLRRDRTAGLFGEGQEGDLEYAKQTEAFRQWVKKHPDEDPTEFYEKLTEPVKAGFVQKLLSRFDDKDPTTPTPEVLKKRREELTGSSSTPTIDKWLTAAKKANPKATDAELRAYYKKKYGAR